MNDIISDKDLNVIFRQARSQNAWRENPVTDVQIKAIYDLMKMGPTSANCCPARFLFLRSQKAKERLKPHLSEGNVKKVMTAPVCVIIGYDTEFYEKLPYLFPHNPKIRDSFAGNAESTRVTAFRNGTLEGAYFLIATRALGLDCGPMSGFNNEGVDREFFPDGKIKSNFICSIGVGDPSAVFPRSPRLSFEEACEVL